MAADLCRFGAPWACSCRWAYQDKQARGSEGGSHGSTQDQGSYPG